MKKILILIALGLLAVSCDKPSSIDRTNSGGLVVTDNSGFKPILRDCPKNLSNYTNQIPNPEEVVWECQKRNWMSLVGCSFTATAKSIPFHEVTATWATNETKFSPLKPERFTIVKVEIPDFSNRRTHIVITVEFQSGKKAKLFPQIGWTDFDLSLECPELSKILKGINWEYCRCE